MPDSIFNETIQIVTSNLQSPDNHLSYFRHKGVKVKFEDIEQALTGCVFVKQAAVLLEEDKDGDKKLVAYIIAGATFNQMEAVNYLAGKLPAYMIPAMWICLEKFPLTTNGNIDKNALQVSAAGTALTFQYIPPRTDTEIKLVTIIRHLLGGQAIGIKDNFFRLGGNSLQALQVIAAIRRELAVELDIKYFFRYATIEALAAYLKKLSANDHLTALVPSRFEQCSAVVPIKSGGSKMPLYIVCGGGGTAFTFEKFAYMLADDQPVYGFQQPSDMKELENFPTTIEEIASEYVNQVMLIDPHGPYALSGHCIGGVIALEMARKLEAMGKKIKLLAMFDVILSKRNKPEPAGIKNLYNVPFRIKKAASKAYLKLDFETFLLVKHPKDAVEYKINSLKSLVNKIYKFQKEDVELMVFKQFEQKFETAFENYQVNKYDGDIVVFYARDHYHFLDKNRNIKFKKFLLEEEIKNIWKDYARSVNIHEMDGEHSTMFEPFYSTEFAGLLQQYLDDCAN